MDTDKKTIHEVHEVKPKPGKKRFNYLLSQLRRGTEQLLFSFLLPSTLSTTSNIVDLQKLVTTGILILSFSLNYNHLILRMHEATKKASFC